MRAALLVLFLVGHAHAACPERTAKEDVAAIASKANAGRAPGSAGDTATRALIEERFHCAGLAPAFGDAFTQSFVADNGATTANVVGIRRGSDPDADIILVAAHHDHLGPGYLGANDNASGVAALLALVDSLKASKRTIVFAAFGDEETGMRGSYYFAAHPPDAVPTERIVQVVNLDMVGSANGFVAAMGTFKHLAATPLVKALRKNHRSLTVGVGGKARGSDFEPFCKQGTPYVFLWTPDKRCYHQRCDVAEKLDYAGMRAIIGLARELVSTLAETEVDLAAAKKQYGCFGN